MGLCKGGAWHGAWGGVWGGGDVWRGWKKCMCILPGLVRLDLSIGGGLDGDSDGEEVVGVVSCEIEKIFVFFLFWVCVFI